MGSCKFLNLVRLVPEYRKHHSQATERRRDAANSRLQRLHAVGVQPRAQHAPGQRQVANAAACALGQPDQPGQRGVQDCRILYGLVLCRRCSWQGSLKRPAEMLISVMPKHTTQETAAFIYCQSDENTTFYSLVSLTPDVL